MADNIKISQLDELLSAQNSTVVPVVDGGTTKKMSLDTLQTHLTASFATTTNLSSEVSTLNSTITALTTDDVAEGSNQYYTDARVKSKLNAESVLSGSTLSVVGGGSVDNVNTITFTGATVGGSAGSAIVTIATPTSLTVNDSLTTVNDVDKISFTGATVTDNGSGDVSVAVSTALSVEGDGGDGGTGVSNITFAGATVTDDGGGFVTVNISSADSVSMLIHTSSINTFTSSINTALNDELFSKSLVSASSQIASDISGSFTSVSSSVESRITTLESSGTSAAGTISGSQQITDFGFISSSFGIDSNVKFIAGDSILISSASNDTLDVTIGVLAAPGGGGTGDVAYINGYHIISQSTSTYESNAILSGMYVDENQNVTFSAFSSSVDSRFGTGGGSDYISNVTFGNNTLAFTGTGFGFNGNVSLADGIISSSTQLNTLGYVTTDDLTAGFIAGVLPQGTVSGSTQIDELGFISYENTPTIVSSSGQISLVNAITESFTTDYVTDTVNRRYYSDSLVKDKLNVESVISSSAQVLESSGLISASEQINYTNVYNKLEIWSGSDSVLIASGTTPGYSPWISIDINSNAFAPATLSSQFDDLSTAFYGVNIPTSSAQLTALGAVASADLIAATTQLNGFTGSLGEYGVTSASIAGRVVALETAGGLSVEAGFEIISQSDSISNLILDLVRVDSTTGDTFGDFSASVAANIAAGSPTTISDLTDTNVGSLVGGDLLKYNATSGDWENTLQLNGAYIITGSLFVTGGAVTADSFVAGDVGTPIIESATDLAITAFTEITLTAPGKGVVIQDILSLNPITGSAPLAPLSGSIMASGSDGNFKPYFWDGNSWREISLV